jgi:3-oxoacyl-[acyl-carrier protein] reductase
MDLQLKGRRVLVTGGSKGIGLATAISFAREGAQPVLVSRSAETLQKARDAVATETGVTPTTLACDLSTSDGLAALVAQMGDVDILVNNAGAIPGGGLADVDDAR